MRPISYAPVLLLLSALLCHAQSNRGVNIYAGYSFVSTNPGLFVPDLSGALVTTDGRTKLNGWVVSLDGKVFHWVDAVFDVGGNYGTAAATYSLWGMFPQPLKFDANLQTYLGGPRVSVSLGRVRPFAEGLFGWSHQTLTSRDVPRGVQGSFAWALGGGIDYRLVKPLAWRVEADYLQMRKFYRDEKQGDVRVSTGLVLSFGH